MPQWIHFIYPQQWSSNTIWCLHGIHLEACWFLRFLPSLVNFLLDPALQLLLWQSGKWCVCFTETLDSVNFFVFGVLWVSLQNFIQTNDRRLFSAPCSGVKSRPSTAEFPEPFPKPQTGQLWREVVFSVCGEKGWCSAEAFTSNRSERFWMEGAGETLTGRLCSKPQQNKTDGA